MQMAQDWMRYQKFVLLNHEGHSTGSRAVGIVHPLQTQPQGALSRAEDLPLLCHVWETPIPHS